MWQFPAVEVNRSARKELAAHLRQATGVAAATLEPLETLRHAVTFRDVRLAPFLVRVSRLPALAGARKLRLPALDRLPVSSATRKIAAAALRATENLRQE
jgi:hypothetical protein